MLLDIMYLTSVVYGVIQASKDGLFILFLRIVKTLLVIALSVKMVDIGGQDHSAPMKAFGFFFSFVTIGWFLSTIAKSTSEEFRLKPNGPVSQTLAVVLFVFFISVVASFIVNGMIQMGVVDAIFIDSSFVYPWIEGLSEIVACKFGYLDIKKLDYLNPCNIINPLLE